MVLQIKSQPTTAENVLYILIVLSPGTLCESSSLPSHAELEIIHPPPFLREAVSPLFQTSSFGNSRFFLLLFFSFALFPYHRIIPSDSLFLEPPFVNAISYLERGERFPRFPCCSFEIFRLCLPVLSSNNTNRGFSRDFLISGLLAHFLG